VSPRLRAGMTQAASAAARYWAACLMKVFEVDVLLCPRCGGELMAVATITNNSELNKLLANLGLPIDKAIASFRSTPATKKS